MEVTYNSQDNSHTIITKDNTFEISEVEEKKLRVLYCGQGKDISQTHIELGWVRDKFLAVKNALNITHSSTIYTKSEMQENDVDDLVEKELLEKYKKYADTLNKKELKILKKQIKEYYVMDGIADKIFKKEKQILKSLPTVADLNEIKSDNDSGSLVLPLADWHLGLDTQNYWNTYNKDVAKERVDELIKSVIKWQEYHKAKTLYIFNLGDIIHGLIHGGVRFNSDLNVTEQCEYAVVLIGYLVEQLAQVFENIKYQYVIGNHGRMIPNKKEQKDGENFEILIDLMLQPVIENIPNVDYSDCIDLDWKVKDVKIENQLVRITHGDNMNTKKAGKKTGNLTNQVPNIILVGHTHTDFYKTDANIRIVSSDSFCGVDQFAKDHYLTGKASQNLLHITESGLTDIHKILF